MYIVQIFQYPESIETIKKTLYELFRRPTVSIDLPPQLHSSAHFQKMPQSVRLAVKISIHFDTKRAIPQKNASKPQKPQNNKPYIPLHLP